MKLYNYFVVTTHYNNKDGRWPRVYRAPIGSTWMDNGAQVHIGNGKFAKPKAMKWPRETGKTYKSVTLARRAMRRLAVAGRKVRR